ncbi:MAG: hypothetical protein C4290_11730, partial [Chloroflexota bacterium]
MPHARTGAINRRWVREPAARESPVRLLPRPPPASHPRRSSTMDERETTLITAVRELARGPFAQRAAEYDRTGTYVRENVDALRALGLAGLSLPQELGGLGLSPEAQMRLMEEIAY